MIIFIYSFIKRMNKAAMEALHESAEAYMVQFMELANMCAIHANPVRPKN